jgi:predicted nuclease with TOPRIM domain
LLDRPVDRDQGTDIVNSSKYPTETRENIKRAQRTFEYRELQRRSAEERNKLEAKIRERNEAIKRLKQKLIDAGFSAADVAKLAA